MASFQQSSVQREKAAANMHISLGGRNEHRQHYLAGKWMSHQRALWVSEEMSSDSDISSLFMIVSEERGGEGRGGKGGRGRRREEMR